MKYRFQYIDQEERQGLINSNSNLFLIEEQNITEGKFLVFSDEIPSAKVIYAEVPKEDFESIQTDLSEVAGTTAIVLGDTTMMAQTTASLVEDNTATAETLAQALLEIENLKEEITTLKGA